MRFLPTGRAVLLVALIVAHVAPGPSAAAELYCPSSAHVKPTKVPAELVQAVALAFQVDQATVRDAAFVRCAGRKLMACYAGANLDCFRADTRRAIPGATGWCRENPGSTGIPMAATGHATIFEWSCEGRRAVAGKATLTADPQGYIAENWKEITAP
jgi:hypothetical protein